MFCEPLKCNLIKRDRAITVHFIYNDCTIKNAYDHTLRQCHRCLARFSQALLRFSITLACFDGDYRCNIDIKNTTQQPLSVIFESSRNCLNKSMACNLRILLKLPYDDTVASSKFTWHWPDRHPWPCSEVFVHKFRKKISSMPTMFIQFYLIATFDYLNTTRAFEVNCDPRTRPWSISSHLTSFNPDNWPKSNNLKLLKLRLSYWSDADACMVIVSVSRIAYKIR